MSPRFWAINIGGGVGCGMGAAAGSRISTAAGNALFGRGPMYYRGGLRSSVEGLISEGVAGVGAAIGEYGGQALVPN